MNAKEMLKKQYEYSPKTELEKAKDSIKGPEQEVLLFFSFDIVNSSKYKTTNYHNWFVVLDIIFKKIKEDVRNRIEKSEFWRSVGDELVFILQINSTEQVEDSIRIIFKILNEMVEKIKNGKIFDGDKRLKKEEIDIIINQNILSLKSTAWIALVTEGYEKYAYNTKELVDGEGMLKYYEFQGNDIDTGFRVSKNSRDRRLTLSFELAYIISKNSELNSKLNIITYKRLKGIWSSDLYPVIWYHDFKVAGTSLEDSFYYDEDEEDDIVKDYFYRLKEECIRDRIKKDCHYELHKVLHDRNLSNKINKIEDNYNKDRLRIQGKKVMDDSYMGNSEHLSEHLSEVHCVAVCVKREINKVLMFKRGEECVFPLKWDFGCVTVENGFSFEQGLENAYKRLYNIDIKVFQPFKAYHFVDSSTGRTVPGIRFLAEIENDSDFKLTNEKYTEKKYVDLENFDELKGEYIEDKDFRSIIVEVLNIKEEA